MALKTSPLAKNEPLTPAQPISAELEVRIRRRFPNPEGTFILNVHFRALAGFTILFGASGAGKTTLLDCIAGLTKPDEGRIAVGGEDLYDSEKKCNVAAWKRKSRLCATGSCALPSFDRRGKHWLWTSQV